MITRDRYHRYTVDGGPPLPGVTSILKLQDCLIGGDLAAWGARTALDYLKGQPGDTEGALASVSAARDLGTAVHADVERVLTGLRPIGSPEHMTALTAFLVKERPEFLHVEQLVANVTVGYGGTFDFIARLRGKVAICDVKTGRLKASHRLQLAAYAAAERMGDAPMPRVRAYYVLLLRPNEYELIQLDVTAADKRHFKALARAYHRAKEWSDAS